MLIKVLDSAVIESHIVVNVEDIVSINIGDDRAWILTKTVSHNNVTKQDTLIVSVEEGHRVIQVFQDRDQNNNERRKSRSLIGSSNS